MAKLAIFALLLAAVVAVCWCATHFDDAPVKRNPHFWKKIKHFRFGFFRRRTRKPIRKPTLPPPKQLPKPKPTKFDIVLLLDASYRVSSHSFQSAKIFTVNVLRYFSVFPAKTRVAAVTFNNKAKLEFDFKSFVNKECVDKKINSLSYSGGSTETGKALEYVRTDLINNASAGARNDAQKIIFLFTTGRWNNWGLQPTRPADKLKKEGVKIFVVRLQGRPLQSQFRPQYYNPSYGGISFGTLRRISSGSYYILSAHSIIDYYRVKKLLKLEDPKRCYGDKPVVDECGRRCKCVRGKLVDCCRLRKEFLDMTTEERVRYINTVKTASTHPSYKPRYEKLLTLHKDIFDSLIHDLEFFLPWHRWFIQQYENLLREIDCRITVPFWDWSLVGADPLSSDVWNPGPHGFGGDGFRGNDEELAMCVTTGPFRHQVWSLVQSAGGGCLKREFKFRTPDAVAVKELIMSNSDPSQFQDFEFALRLEFHDLVHCVIDGTMCTRDSASAPEFFLHHGFVDKIWWDWQKLGRNHTFNEYFMTQTETMPGTPYRSRDYLDLSNQPGCVCAEYVPSRSKIYKALQAASMEKLQRIQRLPMPKMPEKAMKMFKITNKDLERLHYIMEKMKPKHTMKMSSLKSVDHAAGFDTSSIL